MKKHKKRKTKRRDLETKPEHAQTEWVLCSEDWRDIMITYVPDFNNIPIEENYADISQEEIKDPSSNLAKCRKPHKKKTQKVK